MAKIFVDKLINTFDRDAITSETKDSVGIIYVEIHSNHNVAILNNQDDSIDSYVRNIKPGKIMFIKEKESDRMFIVIGDDEDHTYLTKKPVYVSQDRKCLLDIIITTIPFPDIEYQEVEIME